MCPGFVNILGHSDVSDVLVNGKVTISGGTFTGELAGRALAGPGARR